MLRFKDFIYLRVIIARAIGGDARNAAILEEATPRRRITFLGRGFRRMPAASFRTGY